MPEVKWGSSPRAGRFDSAWRAYVTRSLMAVVNQGVRLLASESGSNPGQSTF